MTAKQHSLILSIILAVLFVSTAIIECVFLSILMSGVLNEDVKQVASSLSAMVIISTLYTKLFNKIGGRV